MLEQHLIDYCSPTLASLKTASLFRLPYCSDEELQRCIALYSRHFRKKGVSIKILTQSKHSALVYVYRAKKLMADLAKPGVARFLAQYGYCLDSPDAAIQCLIRRVQSTEDFPHEIGMFLGYPLWDVYGFIHHKGKNCKYTGHWKVYCRECDARKRFDHFTKCRRIYMRLWREGKPILQLTVAA